MSPFREELFLTELAHSGNVAFACVAARTSRRDAFDWRLRHPDFERRWRAAESEAREAFEERLQSATAARN